MMPAKKWTKETIISEINNLNDQGVHMGYKNIKKTKGSLLRSAEREFGSWKNALELVGIDYGEILSISKIKRDNKLKQPRKKTSNEFEIIDNRKELIVNKRDGTQRRVIVDKEFHHNGKIVVNCKNRPYLRIGSNITQLNRYIMGVDNPDINVCHINGNLLDNRIKNLLLVPKKLVSNRNITNEKEMVKINKAKIYTGKETIESLIGGKVLEYCNILYRFNDKLQINFKEGKGWEDSQIPINNLLSLKMTEVATPQVGDWVKVTLPDKTYTGKVIKILGSCFYLDTVDGTYQKLFESADWEILSPEQVSEYKREQAFVKVGRKLNEFREDDFVVIDSLSIVGVIVSKSNADEIRVHKLNEVAGYTVKPHQITPIYFAENQVSLD